MTDREPHIKEIKERLRRVRVIAGIDQKDIARATGVSAEQMGRVERINGTKSVAIEIIWALANFYDMPIDELVGRTPLDLTRPCFNESNFFERRTGELA